MKHRIVAAAVACLLASGSVAARHVEGIDGAAYKGKSKTDAARALLEVARRQAGDGSWELIAIGRIYYLGGYKQDGQAIFDGILAGEHKDNDLFRIARVYREAGEWAKARPLFDRYVADNPDDEKELAEVGAYYLMNGDRATAERLFERAFADKDELWATVSAAGGYLGVAPQE